MSDNTALNNVRSVRDLEAVCIDTSRVYDSCADKDCLADLRVYFTDADQAIINDAISVRARSVDVINVFIEIEKVPFSTGYYSVDATYFFDVELDVYTSPLTSPQNVHGLSVFTKKSILYGGDGSVKVFSSEFSPRVDTQNPSYSTNPRAKVQVATPIPLDARLCAVSDCCNNLSAGVPTIPETVKGRYSGEFIITDTDPAVRVTIGLFSIIRLERDVQLLIPAYDFCMPSKECANDAEDPCDAFRRIAFPVNEFFPPDENDAGTDADRSDLAVNNRCGCNK